MHQQMESEFKFIHLLLLWEVAHRHVGHRSSHAIWRDSRSTLDDESNLTKHSRPFNTRVDGFGLAGIDRAEEGALLTLGL